LIERVLEPELMDDPDESEAYDDMDHAAVNEAFVRDLLSGGEIGEKVLDLGTGTARIPIELCKRHEDCSVIACDAAISMLELAKIIVAVEGCEHRIQLAHVDAKQLELEDGVADCVISNSLIHHLPEPKVGISEMVRVLRSGGRIFVRDLARPDSVDQVETLVATYAGAETEECQQLLRQSLIAALTVEEVQAIVTDFGFPAESVKMSSDRHWTWDATKAG
jgi:ubiquinone/menaquinone biosynthesis C-methylase UbiE